MTALNTANLGSLTIPVPSYDRSTVSVGIVHFGVGGFHRAHQAMYLDQLMEQGQALDWGICGVGVMPFDLAMKRGDGGPGLPLHHGAEGLRAAAGSPGSSDRSWPTGTPRTIRTR